MDENIKGRQVVISIESICDCDSRDASTIEFSTDGLYRYDEASGKGSFMYYESEVTGMAGTRTTVTVSGEDVQVEREGMINGSLQFKPGLRDQFLYNTPYGTAILGIQTRRLQQSFDSHGGDMEIDYVLNLERVTTSKNRFKVNVKEIRNTGVLQ